MNSSRYEVAPDNLQRMVDHMKNKRFQSIRNAKIKALLDKKPKKTKGKYRLAELRLADDWVKFFSEILEHAPYDYVMIIDKELSEYIVNKDKKRIIFHELSHGYNEEGKYKILPHDFEGFYAEIEYNEDDPEWHIRLSEEMDVIHSNS